MGTVGQFLSLNRHAEISPVEAVDRPLVGYAEDYPAYLFAEAHAHSKAQLIYAGTGVMHVETARSSYIIPPSTALVMPADLVHTIYMDGPVAIRTLFLKQSAAPMFFCDCRVNTVTPLLRELILAAFAEPLEWDVKGRGYYITSLALDEIEKSSFLPLEIPLPKSRQLRCVTDALIRTPADPRSLEDWAEVAGASARTLARLFQRETGMSFRQWRQQVRLTTALRNLSLGESSASAAEVAGFESLPAFGAAFRQFFGITPGQARSEKPLS
ncbi:AraC family transcriptional regulator [Roseovarius arcticus]|uniref:AraC family transcriptional regulator n=1 Tax=Roseovarius arcticus TaxID=2547404 RepID=UPI001110E9D2|nr:helix-turn-helix transcriptional regulator [Roseovarius arcticus]